MITPEDGPDRNNSKIESKTMPGRPRGTNYARHDAPFLDQMRIMRNDCGPDGISVSKTANLCAKMAKFPNTLEASAARRLGNGYKKKYPSWGDELLPYRWILI